MYIHPILDFNKQLIKFKCYYIINHNNCCYIYKKVRLLALTPTNVFLNEHLMGYLAFDNLPT